MLEYARWKYILIVVVLLLSTLFALPNVFGDDPAMQIARADHTNLKADDATAIVSYLKDQKVSCRQELRRRRQGDAAVCRRRPSSSRLAMPSRIITRTSTSRRCRSHRVRLNCFVRWGLRPMPLGLDLRGGLYLLYQVDVKGSVSQYLEGYAQDARRALSVANIPVQGCDCRCQRRRSAERHPHRSAAGGGCVRGPHGAEPAVPGRQHDRRSPCPAAPPSWRL